MKEKQRKEAAKQQIDPAPVAVAIPDEDELDQIIFESFFVFIYTHFIFDILHHKTTQKLLHYRFFFPRL